MPSNLLPVSVSPSSTVLPYGLSTAFTESLVFPVLSVSYHDGTIERGMVTDGPTPGGAGITPARAFRTWHMSRRVTTAQLTTLYAFWNTVKGGLLPFFFYEPLGVILPAKPGSNWDATGASTQGRVTCVFRGGWAQSTELGRHTIPALELVEVL